MQSSIPLYDKLAVGYEESFRDLPHRRVYDALAWEYVAPLLPPTPGAIIDAGSGPGRWTERFLQAGHRVIAIEQSSEMAAVLRRKDLGPRLQIVEQDMEQTTLPECSAELVIAMGSLQYVSDPAGMIERFAHWLRPGGHVCVLVDSLLSVVFELLRADDTKSALETARSAKSTWQFADLHLLNIETLFDSMRHAGFAEISAHGLLVSATALGLDRCTELIKQDEAAFLTYERALAKLPSLAAAGRQLLIIGQRL